MTVEVGLAEVEDEAGGNRREGDVPVLSCFVESGLTGLNSADVNEEINVLAETEVIQDTETGSELPTMHSGNVLSPGVEVTESSIRNDVPETGLLIAAQSVGKVPQQVSMDQVEVVELAIVVSTAVLSFIAPSSPAETCTDGRSEPLTEVDISSKTELTEILVVVNRVYTSAKADKPVCTARIGFIRTAYYLTVLVTIAIFLSVNAEGKTKKRHHSGNSEDCFECFHDTLTEIITIFTITF